MNSIESSLHQMKTILDPDRQITHIDRYKVIKTIGKGGFGEVYKVYDPDLDATLAAKVSYSSQIDIDKDFEEARKQKKNEPSGCHTC